jgi:DNA-binding IclR family transcriptional regulator
MALDTDRYRAPALDKGLDILEVLATAEDGLSQAEICKALGRSPNEIYRMLDRLVRRDYVRRTPEDRYTLTMKLFELAHARPPLKRLINQALPLMRRFASESQQACHIVIYDRNALVVMAQVDSPSYWNVSLRVGSRMGLINTGSGHVFLAYADPEERALMLAEQALVPPSVFPADLQARLDRVRAQGFESMDSAQVLAVSNLSAPIFGPLGTVIAVLTCPFAERLDHPDAPSSRETLQFLVETAKALSASVTAASSHKERQTR